LFSGDSIVASTRISLERPDVADHFRSPEVLHSGWSLRVPLERWRAALRDTITLIAMAGDLGAHVPWRPRYSECQVRRIGLPGPTDGTMIRMARDVLPAPAALTLEGQRTVQVVDGAATGYVESLTEADGCASISGWALDATRPEAPVTVLVVQGGAIVHRARPAVTRPDVASALGLTQAAAGFAFALVPGELGDPAREVRVYAITDAGSATELRYLWHTRTVR
jgi:hypothetical protein